MSRGLKDSWRVVLGRYAARRLPSHPWRRQTGAPSLWALAAAIALFALRGCALSHKSDSLAGGTVQDLGNHRTFQGFMEGGASEGKRAAKEIKRILRGE